MSDTPKQSYLLSYNDRKFLKAMRIAQDDIRTEAEPPAPTQDLRDTDAAHRSS